MAEKKYLGRLEFSDKNVFPSIYLQREDITKEDIKKNLDIFRKHNILFLECNYMAAFL